MRNGIMAVILLMVVLLVGCAEIQYGGAKYTRLGDIETKGAYVENIIGPATLTVDPNSGMHNYTIEPEGVYTRFQFDTQESAGTLDIADLADVISKAVIAGLAAN